MIHTRIRRPHPTAFVLAAALLTPLVHAQRAGDPPAAETLWLEGNKLKLKASIYRSAGLSSHPVLIVALHGDLLGLRTVPPTTYHYVFANEASLKLEDVVVAAVLRPGYRDHSGERSQGEQGMATGDNYTPEAVDAVAGVIAQLKAKFHPSRTVLVGHSGGAAIAADLLGRAPSSVDGALLVSCPCDLAAWRRHMMRKQDNNPIWSAPIHALSPLELAGKVSPSARVAVLVGADDDVAPPALSREYADTLRRRVPAVTLTIAPGLGHEILLEPITYEALTTLVESLRLR